MFLRIDINKDIARMDILNLIQKVINNKSYSVSFKGIKLNSITIESVDFDNDCLEVQFTDNRNIYDEIIANPNKYIIRPNITSQRTLNGRLIPLSCNEFNIDIIDDSRNNMTIFEYGYYVLNKYHLDPLNTNIVDMHLCKLSYIRNNSQCLYIEYTDNKNDTIYIVDIICDNISIINKRIEVVVKILHSRYGYKREEIIEITKLPLPRINSILATKSLRHIPELKN